MPPEAPKWIPSSEEQLPYAKNLLAIHPRDKFPQQETPPLSADSEPSVCAGIVVRGAGKLRRAAWFRAGWPAARARGSGLTGADPFDLAPRRSFATPSSLGVRPL